MNCRKEKKTTQEYYYIQTTNFVSYRWGGTLSPWIATCEGAHCPSHQITDQFGSSVEWKWQGNVESSSSFWRKPYWNGTLSATQPNPHALHCLQSGLPPHWEDGDKPAELRRCRWNLMRKLRKLTNLPRLSKHAWLWGITQGRSTHIICYHVVQLATRVSDPHSNTQRLPIANYSNHRRLIQTWEDATDATKFWYFVTAALNTELGFQVLLEIHRLRHF